MLPFISTDIELVGSFPIFDTYRFAIVPFELQTFSIRITGKAILTF